MARAFVFNDPINQPLSDSGRILPGATWTFFEKETTDPATVYADGDLQTPLTNPVAADAAGRFPTIYLDPSVGYRAQLKNSAGVLIRDIDPVWNAAQLTDISDAPYLTHDEDVRLTDARRLLPGTAIEFDDTQDRQLTVHSRAVDYQQFSESGTWTKPAHAKSVYVYVVGGGAGGNSGGKNTADGGNNAGGAGGAGGGWSAAWFDAGALPSTVNVVVGEGGSGGAPQTVNSTIGFAGTPGGVSSFGAYLVASGGEAATTAQLSAHGGRGDVLGGDSGAGGTPTNPGGAAPLFAADSFQRRCGGGGGGGSQGADGSAKGGGVASGFFLNPPLSSFFDAFKTAGAPAVAGAAGGNGGNLGGELGVGAGGGGGAGPGGAGGNGGIPGGGGGGGGCGENDAHNSGAGGAGARGTVVVVTYR